MSYKLTTTGAEVFFNAFYHSLFANGLHYAEAAATGRQALRSQNQRRARYGLMASVHDWIVPVCYIDLNQTASTILWTRAGHLFFYHPFTQNLPMTLSPDGAEGHIGTSQQAVYPTAFAEAAQVDPAPPIIGRDLEVLRLEYKFTLASKIALVLSGPPGAGKTSLVMTLVYWWIRTRFASRVQYISCTSIEFDAVLDEWVTFSSDPSHTPFEGLPWIYIIDHLDEDVVDSARQEPSRVQVRLTEALSRLHCPHAKFLFVTRQMEELFMTSSPMMLLMEQSYEFGVFRLHGLSHIEAAQLGADVLARQHGNEEGVASEQVPYLRRLYDRVGNLPEGIKWILHHCHPDDSGMSVQEVLRQLDCSALTLHIWPSVRIALEALLGRTASQGLNIAFFSLFAGSCPSLGHWEEYLYFLALHEHRVLFPDFQVNSDDLRQTRSILEETAYFSGNADIFDSESHLRALLIVKSWMPTLVTDARRLERLGLVQIADENSAWLSWMHPGLSITLRRFFRLPQFADTGSAADRAFAYAMVMKHFDLQDVNRGINTEVTSRIEVNGTRNVRLGQRKQLIRRGLQNYIRAAQLGRPILCYTSENTGVIPFEGFAAYLIDVMEAINISKYIIEAKVLMQVAKSTLDDFFTAVAAGASLDIRSIETSMALLISTGKMNVGGDESHIGELWGLIRRAALVCDVPGLSIGSQMTLWALQSSPRSLFQNQQPGPSPNQALAPYVRLQAAKNEFLRACRLPGQIEMSDDWLYESFLEYRARWLEYEQSDPPRQQQDVAVLLEERILRTDASVASQADLRRLLAAYARFITHENKNEQVERCFTIEQLRLERRLAEAKDEAYEGLEQAIHSGDLQGEYDFRRYILEVHDDMPPLEAQSYITHLRRLEGELSHHQTVPRNFSVCSCWYPAVQAELADARSDPVGMLQQSLEAISHAIFSCPEWSHAQKTLCGTQNRITSISSTTVLFLRLCLKYKFTNCPDPISLYDVSNSIFKSYVQQRACSTGHIWTYDVEAMHDISQMLDLPLEMVLERLFRVYATAINDQLSPEIQPGVTLETRLSDIRVRLDTEERLLFMPRVLVGSSPRLFGLGTLLTTVQPEVSDRGQETLDDLAGRFTEENLQRWNQSKVRAFSNSLESESSEPRPSLGVCAVLRDVDAFLWNDTFSSSEGLGLRDAEGVHYVLEPQVLRQVTSTRYPLARRWTAVDDLGMQIQRSAERPRGLTHAWSFDVFRRELDNMEHG